MVVISTYEVKEVNLAAIFTVLPLTRRSLPYGLDYIFTAVPLYKPQLPPNNLPKKQGKIKLPPEINHPKDIFSMRYDFWTRGIVRSETSKSFPNAIIIDIGTSSNIVSVKLSSGSLQMAGVTSYETAQEVTNYILELVKEAQENLLFLRNHLETAIKMREKFLAASFTGKGSRQKPEFETEVENQLWKYFEDQTWGYTNENMNSVLEFLFNMAAVGRDLYSGTLEFIDMECVMANLLFNLGYPIDQTAFAAAMNEPPFETSYNNVKSASSVKVIHKYIKYKKDTGQPQEAQHTIQVNKGGHVRYSGPLKAMKPIYYAFMQKVLTYQNRFRSIERNRKVLKITGGVKGYSTEEWKELLRQENEFRQKVINGEIISWEPEPRALELSISTEDLEEAKTEEEKPSPSITLRLLPSPPPSEETIFRFDYEPLLVHLQK